MGIGRHGVLRLHRRRAGRVADFAQDDRGRRWGKFGDLPLLALVLAEVLNDERLHAGDAEQALADGVNGEASEVASNPAAVELLGNGSGGAGAAEAVED